MKRLQFILILLISGIILGQATKNEIKITGKITGKIPKTIAYSLPLESICYFGFKNSIQPDSSGNFEIILTIDKACFIEFSTGYKAYGTIIAEPEMSYAIAINTELKEKNFNVESKNAVGQDLYNQIANRSMNSKGGHFEIDARKYMNDSIASDIKKKIESNRLIEIAPFEALLKKKLISKDFFDLVFTDRDYFYKGLQGSVAFVNYLMENQKKNLLSKAEYSELWGDIFQSNPVTNPELLRSPWFYYYVENYLRYNEFIKDGINSDTKKTLKTEGLIYTYHINYAKKLLSSKQLEYYFAAYIYYQTMNKNYEKELISLFEDFKKSYPSSAYIPFIEPEIMIIIDFHKKQEQLLSEKSIFVDDFNTINSLKEAAKKLNSKLIYVDVWATWCGPCKAEFKNNSELYEYLKTKNIPVLYISIDNDDKIKQWRDMINYYALEGYHIKSNKKLETDLVTIMGEDTFAIPWHILIDGDGNIVKKKVSGPSNLEKLKLELNSN